MKSFDKLLDEAIEDWRQDVRNNYNSVWHDTPVDTERENHPDRPWAFYTDLKTIFAEINDQEELEQSFEEHVVDHWDGEPEDLARETLHYLMFHELYHPIEAPSSREDDKRIHQSIRRGVLESNPELSPEDQYGEVIAAQNLVKDLILDNRFFLDNTEKEFVRKDIIPTFDFVALEGQKKRTDAYTATRYMYGSLFGNEDIQNFFQDKTGSEGVDVAKQVYQAITGQEIDFRELENDERMEHAEEINQVFQNRNQRYSAVKSIAAALEPYIEPGMMNPREGMDGPSMEIDLLQDLLDDMSEDEQQDFLEDLKDNLESSSGGEGQKERNFDPNNLWRSTIHEFYRSNHPETRLIGEGKEARTRDIGSRKYLEVDSTDLVTREDLAELNLNAIRKLQQKGLPVLSETGRDGLYRLVQYDIGDENITDVEHVDASYSLPEAVEFYIDSSGSMFDVDDGFDDGSRWDMLNHALYGMVDAINRKASELGDNCELRLHNFADHQVSSNSFRPAEFLDGVPEVLEVLYNPDNGGDTKGLDIQRYGDGQERTHIVVTDGDLYSNSMAKTQVGKMAQAFGDGERAVMVEIGGTYNLGEKAMQHDIPYLQVHEKEELMEDGIELLLSPRQ